MSSSLWYVVERTDGTLSVSEHNNRPVDAITHGFLFPAMAHLELLRVLWGRGNAAVRAATAAVHAAHGASGAWFDVARAARIETLTALLAAGDHVLLPGFFSGDRSSALICDMHDVPVAEFDLCTSRKHRCTVRGAHISLSHRPEILVDTGRRFIRGEPNNAWFMGWERPNKVELIKLSPEEVDLRKAYAARMGVARATEKPRRA